MIAMATIKLKLTMTDARLKVDRAMLSRNCARAVSGTTRWARGAMRSSDTVSRGTSSTAPSNSAPMAA